MAEKVIGIDFGSTGLKLAEVSIEKGAVTVVKQAYMPLDPGVISGGGIKADNVELVASELKAFLAANKFTSKDAVMGINSAADVYVNRAITPWHEPKNFQTALGFDIIADDGLLLGAPPEVIIDAVVFKEFTDANEKRKIDALLIGVGQKLVELQLEVLHKAGLNAAGADLAGMASLRASWIASRAEGVLDVLVDIGHEVTSVLIHEGGKPYALTLYRGAAGGELNKLISAGLQDDDPERVVKEKVSYNRHFAVQQAMDDYAFKLTSIISGAIESYQSTRPERAQVAGLTLIGAGSLVTNLPATLQESTGLRTMTGRYAIDIGGDPERHHLGPILSTDYMAAVGLAMGATA
ncbi:Tfp pilus assembly protein ATPase PilM-like protein (plasmid) [Pseudarthrobacter chlorophenolicus A6]|uniref:Tfp pilus assembly protein ATPase PilM-like protein n=1 Tax=Pseudarthrobacter chlorophenolicus (strain ATCC 700700 / DSM 12829 / CIP 107037 / JCM 12360 / KCTC 9906 / NCIMB 13794 / A6) TaxID=452863 RepID=B8HI66_PSECP|nr:pilus assembly protein PilM [Pseudarthrobacter chlorophenolicus]ACL42113.1 Tfp pilus assembly protein ATPase PilM-like protein [Pseudarthrobacter chlorophenolicus A6]SDQ13599.1 type IV pilus assembly protein PilM [Pseudarthrobacter chlorophenolicus]